MSVLRSLALAIAVSAVYANTPVIFSVNQPIHPNETVFVMGGPDLSASTVLRLCVNSLCSNISNADASVVSATAVVPGDIALDVYSIAVCGESCSNPLLINTPTVAWMQADSAASVATQGGWIRLFGSALNFDTVTGRCAPTLDSTGHLMSGSARLVPAGGGVALPIPFSLATCYTLSAPIPADTPIGIYTVQITNGLPSCPWTNVTVSPLVVQAPVSWPGEIFDVGTLGVWGALAAAANNSGGVVRFPRGSYRFDENHTLNTIPPFTQVRCLICSALIRRYMAPAIPSASPRCPCSSLARVQTLSPGTGLICPHPQQAAPLSSRVPVATLLYAM
jgi:hypothetical protein